MLRFNHYFQVSMDNVIEYTLEKAGEIPWDRDSMEAIVSSSRGNSNYVYRVWDGKDHSIYIKRAGTEARISRDMKPSRNRNCLESEILMLKDKFTPGMMPHVYFFDTIMCAYGMEDCSNYVVMRDTTLKHETFSKFAEDVSTFMVNTLLPSSDIVTDHKDKKELVKKSISPDLCGITEKLVLMEPYNDLNNRDNVYAPNGDSIKRGLYGDEALHLGATKLKFRFMTDTQALLQGDLHTGLVFIRQDATKIFNSEFGTYAPIGYDIDGVTTNLIFAYDNSLSTSGTPFCGWILKTIEETVNLFMEKFSKKYDRTVTESMVKVEGFKAWCFDGILRDTAGHAGTELHRGVVGMANVVDVITIADEKKRLLVERISILAGKDYIVNQSSFKTGADFVAAIKRAKEAAEKTL